MVEAHIAINKSRVKIYNQKDIYFEDNQEFQFELLNRTSNRVMVDIYMNGEKMSSSVVIPANDRVWLDCNPGTIKKFVYKTFEIDGVVDKEDIKKMIANNGNIEVLFYSEKLPKITWSNTLYEMDLSADFNFTGDLSRTIDNAPENLSHSDVNCTVNYNDTPFINNMTYFNAKLSSHTQPKTRSMSKKVESGIISEGAKSNQTFYQTQFDVEECIGKYNYKILPYSTKPIEVSEIKVYCSNCGKKKVNGWKHCPNCGTEFLIEEDLTINVQIDRLKSKIKKNIFLVDKPTSMINNKVYTTQTLKADTLDEMYIILRTFYTDSIFIYPQNDKLINERDGSYYIRCFVLI